MQLYNPEQPAMAIRYKREVSEIVEHLLRVQEHVKPLQEANGEAALRLALANLEISVEELLITVRTMLDGS
jgi:hypothetical protein